LKIINLWGVSFKQSPIGFKTFCGRNPNKQFNNTAKLFAKIKALETASVINLTDHIHTLSQ